ncbi:aryl-alcohol dehydrogenase (AAD), putative [Aspergillus fumigatus A1163]|uniref:Aryl-alcohol dehydrogenase (AAD), putative n=1 Tax=Aspergillus fumigatus (strain CBS 144.89 / FGSC A1163 / CEA10) TaxID=451804 RepID=B0XST5_ASPFC|nr:aryl-alcohol dehydrogenase (AAD), putative [Aspergillus fumigatus A1163]
MDFQTPEPPTELGRYRILSSNCGLRVSPLQLGAMSIGEAWSSFMGTHEQGAAGGNFIDTANAYQNEQSEAWIGEWMSARKNYWIDILYLHWWDHTTSIEEIMNSLHILVEQGKVLYLGISDTPAWIVAAANAYAAAVGKTPFCIYQGRWNVMLRDFEREILPMARHFGMALAPWNILGSGKFQTREQVEERKKKDTTENQTEAEIRMSEALANVAAEHGIKSVTAVALAYILCKAPNVFPIVGGRKVEHLHDNIQALKIKLTEEQIKYLESVNHFDPGFPSNFLGEDPRVSGKAGRLLATSAPLAFVRAPTAIGYEYLRIGTVAAPRLY